MLMDSTKRHKTANWVKKTRSNHMLLQETHITETKKKQEKKNWFKSKGGKKFSKQMDPKNMREKLYLNLTK
jgi:hypothetical protein